MRIRIKLMFLVLMSGLGFILAFALYLSVDRLVGNIEREKEMLRDLSSSARQTRAIGGELFVGDSLSDAWDTLIHSVDAQDQQFLRMENLTLLPRMNDDIEGALTIISNLRALKDDSFHGLGERYDDMTELLNSVEGFNYFNQMSMISILEKPSFFTKEDWLLIRYYSGNFTSEYFLFDESLEYIISTIEAQMLIIEEETRIIERNSMYAAWIICLVIIAISCFISFRMASRIASDLGLVGTSMARILESDEEVVIDVNRDDELGLLARNIEYIFRQLSVARGQLIQSEKMASLGGLVAGVAHEINTPVGIGVTTSSHIRQVVEDLNQKYESGQLTEEDFQEFISNINESADIISVNMDKAASLINSFKQVAVDRTSEEIRMINALDYIRVLIVSLKPLYKNKNLDIKLHGDETLLIKTMPGTISQIITNMLQNAILHGFPDAREGIIDISIEQAEDRIVLRFADSGIGMNEEQRQKVFEPFYTTKRGVGGGSGLGLHIVYNLVSQVLGGKIRCISSPGEGTEFVIDFPMLAD